MRMTSYYSYFAQTPAYNLLAYGLPKGTMTCTRLQHCLHTHACSASPGMPMVSAQCTCSMAFVELSHECQHLRLKWYRAAASEDAKKSQRTTDVAMQETNYQKDVWIAMARM